MGENQYFEVVWSSGEKYIEMVWSKERKMSEEFLKILYVSEIEGPRKRL